MPKPFAAALVGLVVLMPVAALADDASFLAAFKRYPITLKPDPNFDVSPYAFDFSKQKLTARYAGYSCRFTLQRLDHDPADVIGTGQLEFTDDSRVSFAGNWRTGGLATSDTFNDANVAVADKGVLVGKMPMFPEFINQGSAPEEAIVANVKVTKGALGKEVPEGVLVYRLTDWMEASMTIAGCKKP